MAIGAEPTDLSTLEDASAEDVLRWGFEAYHPGIALVTSFQAEGMVLLDMAHRLQPDLRVVTIDTGRLPQETYTLIDQIRGRYSVVVEVVFPEARHVETIVERNGMNLFYNDPSLRQLCCHVRKVLPLRKALERFDAWIAGLRREQSPTRADTPKVHVDAAHDGIMKLNPLADWTQQQVWDYIHTHKVPYHSLYDQGYQSIGCAPCTRAIPPGQPERAGRWWWEADEGKECGIHNQSRDQRFQEEVAWLEK